MNEGTEGAADVRPLEVESRDDGRLRILTLNRPARLNAVSLELYRDLHAAITAAAAAADVRVVLLTGAGRAFCVGADLKAHAGDEPTTQDRRRYIRAAQRAAAALQRCGKPVVAAVNGHAIGAGLELALACDFIVVAAEAKLRFPEVALGTFVGGGVTYTLPRRVGHARAAELLMLADFFTPAQALEMGLVNRVVAAGQVRDAALELARRLVERAPISLRHTKRLLQANPRLQPEAALRREAAALLACMRTADWREGVDAFAERRTPVFHGR